jgi:hypothetical protein
MSGELRGVDPLGGEHAPASAVRISRVLVLVGPDATTGARRGRAEPTVPGVHMTASGGAQRPYRQEGRPGEAGSRRSDGGSP